MFCMRGGEGRPVSLVCWSGLYYTGQHLTLAGSPRLLIHFIGFGSVQGGGKPGRERDREIEIGAMRALERNFIV